MYLPDHFRETDPGKLFDFIERHSFGLLVSQLDNEPFASHLPLLLDRRWGPSGTLVATWHERSSLADDGSPWQGSTRYACNQSA